MHILNTLSLRNVYVIVVVAWTICLSCAGVWEIHQTQAGMMTLATKEAEANFNKDVSFRMWAALHGGVYVPIGWRTQPNPYLAHVDERDIETPSGRQLTLMNPAFMLRQMMEEFTQEYGITGRIVSGLPLNPDNMADEWELQALEEFRHGITAKTEVVKLDGTPHLRYFSPLFVQESCLKCHAHQGYKVGDIRGGVGVNVPLTPYLVEHDSRSVRIVSVLLFLWVSGLGTLWVLYRKNLQRVEERAKFEQELWHQANHDSLTGLPNRQKFLNDLKDLHGTQDFAILFIDLDNFKVLNDTRGHDYGDQILQIIAKRVSHSIRNTDVAARLGGDEFVVCLLGASDRADVRHIASNIISSVSRTIHIEDSSANLSASVGVTMVSRTDPYSDDVVEQADAAMYNAKQSGKNRLAFYNTDMIQGFKDTMNIASMLKTALERQEFHLVYQPLVLAKGGSMCGVEALLRWNHPERGLIPPGEFIPVAESTGLMFDIGRFVIDSSFKQLTEWDHQGIDVPYLSINISPQQCSSLELLTCLRISSKTYDVNLARVVVELTESAFLQDTDSTYDVILGLHDLGVHIAIDDFGTGYSSFAYLKRFHVDRLKIDRTFVDGLPTDLEDVALCSAIISMAKALNIHVVAEGIETEAQAEYLRSLNCEVLQGYHFSRPVSSDDVATFCCVHDGDCDLDRTGPCSISQTLAT